MKNFMLKKWAMLGALLFAFAVQIGAVKCMAKITFGQIVSEASGKLGGVVFSRNRAGAYLRTKVTPTNPQTTAQSLVRGRITTPSQAWRNLTEPQRQAWIAAAEMDAVVTKMGHSSKLSGFGYYVMLNRNLLEIGASLLTAPPALGTALPITSLSVSSVVAGSVLSATFAPAIAATEKVVLYATPAISAGKAYVKNQFRVIHVLDSADTSPCDISALYTAKFGTLPALGKKVGIAVRPIKLSTGQSAAKIQAQTVTAAT